MSEKLMRALVDKILYLEEMIEHLLERTDYLKEEIILLKKKKGRESLRSFDCTSLRDQQFSKK